MTKPQLYYFGKDEPSAVPYHYRECGLDGIFLMNGYSTEEVDGDEYVSIENVDGLWKAIGINLVTQRKTFSPSEIRFLRNQIGMTQAELASMLRVDDQTVARWEKKQSKIPGPADFGLRVIFLASEVAQPEGNKILENLLDTMKELIENDSPLVEETHFVQYGHKWETQRIAVSC